MARDNTGRHAFLVGIGILLSRIMGLVRQRVFSHYFGLSDTADAFSSALRVPNFLQNLFGEGVLSASFIPVYARLLAEGKDEEADHVAGAVGALLALTISVIVLIGILATPWLLWVIAPGYGGAKRELTILLVRILFPGTGLLVCSAWCLGILNSHRKFFLSYSAPVVWNAAMIASLLIFRHAGQEQLAVYLAWGTVAGCALQFLIQLPPVLRYTTHLRLNFDTGSRHVREVVRNFGSVAISRGVVQISAYVDQALSSLLGQGAMAAMTTAASINMLPVSLFGMAVSAAELPAMSSAVGATHDRDTYAALATRLNAGLRRIAFFIVPSAVAFFALGDVITAALYQTGKFTHAHTLYVWGIIAGSGVGLLATTLGRLYASTYYALRDTRSPLRFALIRLLLTTVLGVGCVLLVTPVLGLAPRWGAAGLTASAGMAGWVEFMLLRRKLNARIGHTGLPAGLMINLWGLALASAAFAWVLKLQFGGGHPILLAMLVLGTYGGLYFLLTWLFGIDECRALLARVLRRFAR
ncbi:murein biosynthesis integral membrane protein MurJ [Paludibacterium purpuratum]|uniref:Probable lipid II flippase MurJ n=1 Tax=Paludibacterium purpuratum TaxID=1144873 RepID=A0A4V3DUM4_9NEIS|nr:murein biosynthesis integral membrane protein MurJ [Paludibacterium purpuratum]TDR73920.1 putative peptidoglycan lipid II flippase [Paludibacterium purpuratum]